MFGRFPEAGDSFEYGNLTVTVLAMDKQRVDKLLVRRREEPAEDGE